MSADSTSYRASADAAHRLAIVGNAPGLDQIVSQLDLHDISVRLMPFDIDLEHMPAASDSVILLAHSSAQKAIAACKRLRERKCPLPLVIFLSRHDSFDEALSLEIGADEVLHADMQPRVVASRLRALLRRATKPARSAVTTLVFGALAISGSTRSVTLRGDRLSLSSGEFDLLWLLASNAGRVIRRDEVQKQLRGFSHAESNRYVDMRFYRLQKRFPSVSDIHTRLRTVRPCGYMFADIEW